MKCLSPSYHLPCITMIYKIRPIADIKSFDFDLA